MRQIKLNVSVGELSIVVDALIEQRVEESGDMRVTIGDMIADYQNVIDKSLDGGCCGNKKEDCDEDS